MKFKISENDTEQTDLLKNLEMLDIEEFAGYQLDKLLFIETWWGIVKNTGDKIKTSIKVNFFDTFKITSNSKKSKLLLYTYKYERQDHATYWNRVRELFTDYSEIEINDVKTKFSDISGFGNIRKKVRKTCQYYRKLNFVKDFSQRVYLASRLMELFIIKNYLDSCEFKPAVEMTFFDAGFYENIACQYYKLKGAKTVTFQHGQPIFRGIDTDRINQSQILNFTSDYFIASGKFTKKQLEMAEICKEKIVEIGTLLNIVRIKQSSEKKKEFGVFLDCPTLQFSSKTNSELIDIANKVSDRLNMSYILKLHPLDSQSKYQNCVNQNCKEIIEKGASFDKIANRIEFGIFNASAIYLDLTSKGIKSYKLQSCEFFPLVESEMDIFKGSTELIEKIHLWDNCSQTEKNQHFEELLVYYMNPNDAPARLQDFIKKLCDEK